MTKLTTGWRTVSESTEPLALTLPMATVASAPAVQPLLAWNFCSASRVLNTYTTALDCPPTCQPTEAPVVL